MIRFEVAHWMRTLSDLQPNEWSTFTPPPVVGPRDACYSVAMRDKLADRLAFGVAHAADLFVLAIGEPRDRLSTKIGGLPYWRSDRPWPVSESRTPLPFLAQFDLSGSKDLLPDIPWDVIHIFAHTDVRRGAVVTSENRCKPELLVGRHELRLDASIPVYSCARWRTVVFPDWVPLEGDSWSTCEFTDGTRIDDIYFAMHPLGMQIGPCPFIPSGTRLVDANEVVLCSMPSIAPRAGHRFPFLNREAPLTFEEAEASSIILSDIDDDDGFGVFYIVMGDDDSLKLRYTNL